MNLYKMIERDMKTAIAARKIGRHKIFGYLAIPGVGKTDMIQQVCASLDLRFFGEMVLSSCSPMDIMAKIPNTEEEVLSSYPNDDLPLDSVVGDDMCLWFIDEGTNASSDVWKALQQGLQSRKFGKHMLGKNVIIMIAGNRQSDKAGAGVLSTAIYNRVTWRNVVWNAKSSDIAVEYLMDKHATEDKAGVEVMAMIQGYFAHKPMLESDFADALGKLGKEAYVQWCSPRSLDSLLCSISVNGWKLPDIEDMAGDIGFGRATELFSFNALLDKVEKYEKVVSDPEGAKLPESIEAKYAMLSMLAVRVNKADFDAVWKYMSRIKEVTLRVVFITMAMKRTPAVRETKAYENLYNTDKELVSAIGAV